MVAMWSGADRSNALGAWRVCRNGNTADPGAIDR